MVVKEKCYWVHLEGFQVVSRQFRALLGTVLTGQGHRSDRSACWPCSDVGHRSDRCCGPVWQLRAEMMQLLYFVKRMECIRLGGVALAQEELAGVQGGSLWFSSFGLVVFCSLSELVFFSVVSSHCPCLRGPRLVFFNWSYSLPFPWLSITCWSFFVSFFSFPFFLWYQMCVLSMHSSRGRLRACVVQGLVDGRFLVWWVIDNVVWTNS
jgi:hypothetical protein